MSKIEESKIKMVQDKLDGKDTLIDAAIKYKELLAGKKKIEDDWQELRIRRTQLNEEIDKKIAVCQKSIEEYDYQIERQKRVVLQFAEK